MAASFLNIFATSPFKPLQVHMAIVYECASGLEKFFEAAFNGHWDEAAGYHAEIVRLENKADERKKDIRLHLPNSIFMPVSRSDLLQLLKAQDRIANRAKDVSGIVLGRKLSFPTEIVTTYRHLLSCSYQAIEQAAKAAGAFDELLETGFKGHEADLVEAMVVRLDELEDLSDKAQVEVRTKLFAIERDLPPVDVMFLYKVIEWTGVLADKAQHVGHCLQLLLAH